MGADDRLAVEFERQRRRLRGLAYRMLGFGQRRRRRRAGRVAAANSSLISASWARSPAASARILRMTVPTRALTSAPVRGDIRQFTILCPAGG